VAAKESADAVSNGWNQQEQYQKNCRGGEATSHQKEFLAREVGSGHICRRRARRFTECEVILGRWNARFGGAWLQMAAECFQIREHFAGAAVASDSIFGEGTVNDAPEIQRNFIRKRGASLRMAKIVAVGDSR